MNIETMREPTRENPIIVFNYPYGFTQRTDACYYIDTTKRGQRVIFKTKNPKTQQWNKEKKSTYSDVRVLYRNLDNGHIENDGLDFAYDGKEELDKFLEHFETVLTEYQRGQIKIFRAIINTRKYVKVSIVSNPTEKETEQIEKDNKDTQKTLRRAFEHEYRKLSEV